MSKKVILFDLDGTLLPMDQNIFVKSYFGKLTKKLAPLGYQPEKLIEALWAGIKTVVKNTSDKLNEEVFWDVFAKFLGEKVREDEKHFEEFYKNEFQAVKEDCGYNPKAAASMKQLKKMGYRVVLATNPIFPRIATESRVRWAGIEPETFELITTYENCKRSKPNPQYYLEIVEKLNVKPEECIMVGNDVTEDMVAQTIGMDVFLLTDCLLNKEGKDYSQYPQGSFDEMMEYIKR